MASDLKEDEWRYPRCFWRVGVYRDDPQRLLHPIVTADYWMDCALGRALAEEFHAAMGLYPHLRAEVLGNIMKHMVAVGRLSGVEVAFIEATVGRNAPVIRHY